MFNVSLYGLIFNMLILGEAKRANQKHQVEK